MSLFNTIATDSDESVTPEAVEPQSTAPTEPSWWIDEGVPGVGERPQWLPEKYKKISDLAKSYSELEKKFGYVPESYNFDKAQEWLDPEYEKVQEFAEFARSKRVPQEVLDKMFEAVGGYLNEFKSDPAEEIAALGDNAAERLRVLGNWAKSNLTESSYAALTQNMRTADAVRALEEIREKMISSSTQIAGNANVVETALTLEDLQQELTANYGRYKTDAKYRREITSKIEMLSSRK